MTFKARFAQQNKKFKVSPNQYSLDKLKGQSPDVYLAHNMMANTSGKRCDNFVLCDCATAVTGIYVIEIKGSNPSASDVKKQLQSGSNFIAGFLRQNDKFEFLPVLVAGAIPRSTAKTFRNMRIHLSGKNRYVKHVRTNGPLEKLSP